MPRAWHLDGLTEGPGGEEQRTSTGAGQVDMDAAVSDRRTTEVALLPTRHFSSSARRAPVDAKAYAARVNLVDPR